MNSQKLFYCIVVLKKSFHKKKKIEKGEGAFSLSLTVEVDRVHSDVDSSASTLFILPDFWNLQTKSFKI